MTTCESDPRQGGKYHFVLDMPEFGRASWHGTYTTIDHPTGLQSDEWFVMGERGPPTVIPASRRFRSSQSRAAGR